MSILIDNREHKLIASIQAIAPTLNVTIGALPLGDIVLNGSILVERKTIDDLVASIKDGRYNEQSFRLAGTTDYDNHNIMYLLEGDIRGYKPDVRARVYSAIVSLSHFKGFSVMRTMSVDETAAFLVQAATKLAKEAAAPSGHRPYRAAAAAAEGESSVSVSGGTKAPYVSAVKRIKKDNVTPANIGEMLLCAIPGIGDVVAVAIMAHYDGKWLRLMQDVVDNGALPAISYTNDAGQTRKVSSKCLADIVRYLRNETVSDEPPKNDE